MFSKSGERILLGHFHYSYLRHITDAKKIDF